MAHTRPDTAAWQSCKPAALTSAEERERLNDQGGGYMNRPALAVEDAAAPQVPVRGISPTCHDCHTCYKINRLKDTRELKCIDNIDHLVTFAIG